MCVYIFFLKSTSQRKMKKEKKRKRKEWEVQKKTKINEDEKKNCHAPNLTIKIGTWQPPHANKVSPLQVCKAFLTTKNYTKKLHQINPKYLNNFFMNRSPIIRKEQNPNLIYIYCKDAIWVLSLKRSANCKESVWVLSLKSKWI